MKKIIITSFVIIAIMSFSGCQEEVEKRQPKEQKMNEIEFEQNMEEENQQEEKNIVVEPEEVKNEMNKLKTIINNSESTLEDCDSLKDDNIKRICTDAFK